MDLSNANMSDNKKAESIILKNSIKMGLDPVVILNHFSFVKEQLKKGYTQKFKIIDTCRLDNGRIFPEDWLSHEMTNTQDEEDIVAFVPSAGAASRYSKPIQDLHLYLLLEKKEELLHTISDFKKSHWILPSEINDFIKNFRPENKISQEAINLIGNIAKNPKGLFPCSRQNISFFQMKCMEHRALTSLCGEIFIVSPEFLPQIKNNIQEFTSLKDTKAFKTSLLVQDFDLATVRFDHKAFPITDDQGLLSVVPAGHGALVKKFSEVKKKFPNAQSLFIRNIDNIGGLNKSFLKTSAQFLKTHQTLLKKIKRIRTFLKENNLKKAADESLPLLKTTGNHLYDGNIKLFCETLKNPWEKILWKTLFLVFQLPFHMKSQGLLSLFLRPLNTMGQVPNEGKDIGGTPVVIEKDGHHIPICLETPHAYEDDLSNFLSNSRKATHFNPVFLATEIIDNAEATYKVKENPFWILSKKLWRDQEVYYYETILYELLGNSELTNVTFIELPRLVFCPHKTLDDTNKYHSANFTRCP